MLKKFDVTKINVYTIVSDLLYNLWVIILAVIVGFLGSLVYFTYFHSKIYTSEMTISVNLSGYTANSTSVSLARTVTLAETLDDVFKSDAMFKAAQNASDIPLSGKVRATQYPDTNLIRVIAKASSPRDAYNALKAVSENYHYVTDHSFSNVIIKVVSDPTMPTGPSNSMSNFKSCLLLGILVGMLVAVLFAVLSYLRDTVKNVSDVESELNTRLFGTVYNTKKPSKKLPDSKRRMLISNTLVGYDFTESFRKIAVKIESLKRTKGVKVLMITSSAEDEGKTTVSCNTAAALASNGHKVLLIDCDFKKPAVKHFFSEVAHDQENDFHLFVEKGGDINNYIKHDPETGLYLLDSVEPCAHSAEKLSYPGFADTIAALKEDFDFIVIDTPPTGLIIDAEIVSGVVDAVLMVVRQDYVHVRDINDQIENLSKAYFAGCIFNNIREFKFETNQYELETPSHQPGQNA